MFYLLIEANGARSNREKHTMPLKSSRDVATSLSGSAFRRMVFDSRTRMLREIPTGVRLGRNVTRPLRRDRGKTPSAR
jgi:hypothetical protein